MTPELRADLARLLGELSAVQAALARLNLPDGASPKSDVDALIGLGLPDRSSRQRLRVELARQAFRVVPIAKQLRHRHRSADLLMKRRRAFQKRAFRIGDGSASMRSLDLPGSSS